MKRTIVMLAVAAASMVAIAQPPPNSTSTPPPTPALTQPALASVSPQPAPSLKKESVQIPKIVVFTPLSNLGKPLVKNKIKRVDGMSSRPWEQIVGIHPGYSSFPPPEMHEPTTYLFWIGRDPHQ
jgi:hypothetical protein